MNLNTENWSYFDLNDLFIITGTKTTPLVELETYGIGKYPYVTTQSTNNGVGGFYNYYTEKGNVLTVDSAVLGFCTYQELNFSASDHVEKLIPKFNMNKYIGLFFTVIMNCNTYKYSYGRKASQKKLKCVKIKLPTDAQGNPDWDFMERYIKSLHNNPITTNIYNKSLDTSFKKYNSFLIKELFTVKYGINMELVNCTVCNKKEKDSVNFVSRTSENNGVVARVKIQQGFQPQKAGTITCAGGGSVLSTFVQTDDFYSGRDLYLLIPKYNMSIYSKLYICTIIEANKYRYNYGRQANKTLPYISLKLPSKKDGTPDFEYMENYIKSLPYSDRI